MKRHIILDLGCGYPWPVKNKHKVRHLLKKEFYIGLDMYALSCYKTPPFEMGEEFRNIQNIQGSYYGQHLPFQTASIDEILLFGAGGENPKHHTKEEMQRNRMILLNEIHRILKIGGKFLSEKDNSYSPDYFTAFLTFQLMVDKRFTVKSHMYDISSYSDWTAKQIKRLIMLR